MSEITVHIKCSNSDKAEIKIELSATVLQLKEKVGEALAVPANQQRLIYKGRVLKDELTLENYEVQDGHTVHMVKGASAAAAANTSTRSAAASNPSSSSIPAPNTTPSPNPASGTPQFPNPFGAGGNPFGGAGGNPLMGMPDMGRMQEQLLRNPEMMQQIMNSPMMESLMNNPDLMRNMMLNNPQMQSLLDSNPQIRHILNDPAVLRQSMEMMRNPNAMREAMRNQDLAMSQLENLPGGFNALRRMFEEVHEPMMEATQNIGLNTTANNPANNSNATSSTPASTAPTNSAVPNPWGGGAPNTNIPNPWGGAPANPAAAFGANPFLNPLANPALGGMGGMGSLDPAAVAQMMQDPLVQQTMQQMLSDPDMVQRLSAANPQLGVAMQNPQMRAMMTNPQFLQQISNPANLQAMMQMQQAMQTLQGNGLMPNVLGMPPLGGGGFGANRFNNPALSPDIAALNFDSLLGGTGRGSGVPPQPRPAPVPVDPAVRYAAQVQQLRDMGFLDDEANLRAIQATSGNVNAAVERLLGGN